MSYTDSLLEDIYRRGDRMMLPVLWLLFFAGLGFATG